MPTNNNNGSSGGIWDTIVGAMNGAPGFDPDKLSEFLKSPAFAYYLGAAANATNPQGSWGQMMGAQAQQMAKNMLFAQALEQALKGTQESLTQSPKADQTVPAPTQVQALGLSPEQQSSVVQSGLSTQAQRLAEKEAHINDIYKLSMAQAQLERNAIDWARALAPKGSKVVTMQVDAGDKKFVLAIDPQTGTVVNRHVFPVSAKPGSGGGSGKTSASMYTEMRKKLATSFYPLLESIYKTMYPKESDFSKRMSMLKGDQGSLDLNTLAAAFKELGPVTQSIWEDYYSRLEQAVRNGEPISSVKMPIIKTADKTSKDDVKKPVIYIKDMGDVVKYYYKPEESTDAEEIYTVKKQR